MTTPSSPQGLAAELAAMIAALRQQAERASEASRMLAEAKSLRQNDHDGPPRADLYSYATPEQTLEWRAADLLSTNTEAMALLARLCDAYELVCNDSGLTYHHSPGSVYAHCRNLLGSADHGG